MPSNKLSKLLFGVAGSVSLALCSSFANASGYYDSLKSYLADNMPGEAMLPTPYGADSRFRPKTIWVYLDEYQANPSKPKRQSAWVIAASGDSFYGDVNVVSNPINLPTRNITKNKKFALTAAIAGTVSKEDFEAALELANSENVELSIDLGEVSIEYVNYFDMLLAQTDTSYQRKMDTLNSLLKQRYGGDTPRRRIITAALKVKGAKITANISESKSFSAKLIALFSSIGFNYDNKTKSFDTMGFSDWRYIAYAARYTNSYGLISTGTEPQIEDSEESNIPLDENIEW